MYEVELLFLGTGTSAGVPMIACHCEVCESDDARDKRTRCSVVITAGGQRVLVDTTPELRLQCVANRVDAIDAVVYTHPHADHIMGLDDLRRFNAVRGDPLDAWADERTHASIERCFGYAFREPEADTKLFRPHLRRRTIAGPFEIGAARWTPVPLLHGELPVLGFRVGHLAYLTDVSHIPDESWPLLKDLDVLILDALQWKRHTTHFSVEEAIEVARRVRPKQTLFTHIAHALGHVETNKLLPEGMLLAYDGQTVSARAD